MIPGILAMLDEFAYRLATWGTRTMDDPKTPYIIIGIVLLLTGIVIGTELSR